MYDILYALLLAPLFALSGLLREAFDLILSHYKKEYRFTAESQEYLWLTQWIEKDCWPFAKHNDGTGKKTYDATFFGMGITKSLRYASSNNCNYLVFTRYSRIPCLCKVDNATRTVTFQVPSANPQQKMEDILRLAKERYNGESDEISVFFTDGSYGSWERCKRLRRPVSSIFLPGDLVRTIIDDATTFFGTESRQFYERIGVIYKKVFLLHGPPGTGKTSLVSAIATSLSMPIYYLTLDDYFLRQVRHIPSGPVIIVLEDLDRFFRQQEEENSQNGAYRGRIAERLQNLLNLLDGAHSRPETLFVITANHPEEFDEALTRSCRMDSKYYVGPLGATEALSLFCAIFPEATEDERRDFSLRIGEASITGAALQNYLFDRRGDVRRAIEEWTDSLCTPNK